MGEVTVAMGRVTGTLLPFRMDKEHGTEFLDIVQSRKSVQVQFIIIRGPSPRPCSWQPQRRGSTCSDTEFNTAVGSNKKVAMGKKKMAMGPAREWSELRGTCSDP